LDAEASKLNDGYFKEGSSHFDLEYVMSSHNSHSIYQNFKIVPD